MSASTTYNLLISSVGLLVHLRLPYFWVFSQPSMPSSLFFLPPFGVKFLVYLHYYFVCIPTVRCNKSCRFFFSFEN
jgi:hypothetical protein